MSVTRQAVPKMYESCKSCPNNISGYGKCNIKFENFYYRKGKDNGCPYCKDELYKIWKGNNGI